MYPPASETRLIVDEEMVRIFRQLEKLEAEGLENYVIPLAIRLQFEFAARLYPPARMELAGLREPARGVARQQGRRHFRP